VDTVELVGSVTAAAAFLTPRIIAFVPGGREEKQRAADLISVVVGLAVAVIDARIWESPDFNVSTLAAFMFTTLATRAGQESLYTGFWERRLEDEGEKEEQELDATVTKWLDGEPMPGSVGGIAYSNASGSNPAQDEWGPRGADDETGLDFFAALEAVEATP